MRILICLCLMIVVNSIFAQFDFIDTMPLPPSKDKWEVGLHTGHFFTAGDITFDPGYAVGLHLRKSIGYILSLRLDASYGEMSGVRFNGENEFQTQLFSSTVQGLISLNSLKLDTAPSRSNLYIYIGGGVNHFNVTHDNNGGRGGKDVENALSPALDMGIGFSIKINKNTNVSVDHKVTTLFSRYGDQLDGFQNEGFRDMTNYTSVRVNFNFGKRQHTEPKYWMNPIGKLLVEFDSLKRKPNFIPRDDDGDGVLNEFDLEENTPPGVPVDTRGITLDSDKDGIPNYKDKEPYSPPDFEYDEYGVAIKPLPLTEQKVDSLIQSQMQRNKQLPWFLPIIHFRAGQYEIRSSEIIKLEHILKVLRRYEDLRLTIIGYTDQTGEEATNQLLSYQRSKAVIDYLVERGIPRAKLLLNWKGEQDALVVDKEDSYMNRRVEFRVAEKWEEDMGKPD